VHTLFHVQDNAITQHTLSLAASLAITDARMLPNTCVQLFIESISGPVGQIPGASASFDVQTDSLVAGLNIKFGAPKKPAVVAAVAPEVTP